MSNKVEERVNKVERQQAISEDISPEERVYREAAAATQAIMKASKDIQKAASTLITARRMYAIGYIELQRLLAAREDAHEMSEDFIVQSAMHQAAKPFSEHEFMDMMIKVAMPWLVETIDSHTEADEKEQKDIAQAEEQSRRVNPLPIGFKIDFEDEESMSRDRSLTLVGYAPACRFVAEKIANAVLAAREHQLFNVFWFTGTRRDGSHQLARMSPNEWHGCTNSKKLLTKVFMDCVALVTAPPDLVICDDLPRCYTQSYVGRPDPAIAGDAHKELFKMCKQHGAGLVSFIPMVSELDPDIGMPEYEQVKTFSRLRPIRVRRNVDNGEVTIHIGTSLTKWTITGEQLDAYKTSNVLRG